MNHPEISRHKDRIDGLFELGRGPNFDGTVAAHWSRYLCVLISGFLEDSVRTILIDYATRRAQPSCARFIIGRVREFSNAKMNKILDLIGEFDGEARAELERFVERRLKDSVDSIVNNRHQIAHGRSAGIGLAELRDYYRSVVRVIDEIERRFD